MAEVLSLLTFPQRLQDGLLQFNILIVPRNISPLQPLLPGKPSFANASIRFKAQVVNSLDDLPQMADVLNPAPDLQTISGTTIDLNDFYNKLKDQFQDSEKITITEAKPGQRATKLTSNIRKYLPESYRSSFNFTNPITRYASTDDAYHCAVKKVKAQPAPAPVTEIPWGKAIGYCLRNPLLAKQAGLIYNASISAAGLYEKGGWLFVWFDDDSDYKDLNADTDVRLYAARIPALKNVAERALFAPVLFRVSSVAAGDGLDHVFEEAITYNDGFAHIVHASQPVNQYYLEEKDPSNPPSKDTGIRLGWDDEQLLIWQNRQATQMDEFSGLSVDAPLGVFGYRIDAKDITAGGAWASLNAVQTKDNLLLGGLPITPMHTPFEPGVEVTPTQLEAGVSDYWMPMYYTSWVGRSLVLTDEDAQEIYKQKDAAKNPDPTAPAVAESMYRKAKDVQSPYEAIGLDTLQLRYGHEYKFRVRMMDITGGGPSITDSPLLPAKAPVADWKFQRFVTAQALRISSAIDGKTLDHNFQLNEDMDLQIERPLLGYPAVVFTGKYLDPIKDLKDHATASVAAGISFQPALPDPDVARFSVLVEVKSLYMDNGLSATGSESYIKLYEKDFAFSAASFYTPRTIGVRFIDVQQATLDGSGIDHQFDGSADELILPSARSLRITFTPVVSDTDNVYASEFVKYGKNVSVPARSASSLERDLFENPDDFLRAIYLQPEEETNVHATDVLFLNATLRGTPIQKADSLVQRIADDLDLDAKQLSLLGRTGERVQFGCSRHIRHSLSPDYTSLTFSSKKELLNHWLVLVDLQLNRDWAWNALQPESILIERKITTGEGVSVLYESAGHIKLSNAINITALTEPQRERSRLVFFDAFDPKEVLKKFPREVTLTYRITPQFEAGFGASNDGELSDSITLPITINPVQIPKIASTGIAQTAYDFDEKYSTTEMRSRFLWVEFEEPVADKQDAFYCRTLAYAADPLIRSFPFSADFLSSVAATTEPALPIAPEPIRKIIPGMSNDFAGATAMQEMIQSTSSDRHYLVPLPPGLHADSPELFGFFTYEIRVGHSKNIWSTAQGRFGRPLRVTGVQHPTPALTCITSRIKKRVGALVKEEISVTAPYAKAVQDGKNITAHPPNTSLWCLLYAQVKQADDSSWRNILVETKELFLHKEETKMAIARNSDGQAFGNVVFDIAALRVTLQNMGLPTNSPLSVLCVEMLPLNNQWHFDLPNRRGKLAMAGGGEDVEAATDVAAPINPLREGLGYFRILRTSPLYKVADVCCDDC